MEWLSKSKAVSATAAYAALEKYLEGKSRSVQESEWIELVIGHQGFPPEPFTNAPPPVTPSPGSDGRGSAPVPSQAPRTPAMVAPSGLRATEVGSTSINVDCANVPGADGYQFYVNGRMYGRTVVGSNMRITGLRPGTTYSISTRAVFDWQNGPMSPAIRVTTKR